MASNQDYMDDPRRPDTYKIKNEDGETVAGPFESRIEAREELERLQDLDEDDDEIEEQMRPLDALHLFPDA